MTPATGSTEDRLTAALAARADGVQTEHLRPVVVPPRRSRLRRGALSVAVAACVAVAVPVVVHGTRDGAEPGPSTTPRVTPSSPVPRRHDSSTSAAGQDADLDGDGTRDKVELKASDQGGAVISSRLRVRLASGKRVGADVPRLVDPGLRDPLRLSGGAREDLVVAETHGNVDRVFVYALTDRGLARATRSAMAAAPLAGGVDGRGRTTGWLVEGSRLLSFRTRTPVADPAAAYPSDVWSWTVRVDGGAAVLEPTVDPTRCVVPERSQRLEPC